VELAYNIISTSIIITLYSFVAIWFIFFKDKEEMKIYILKTIFIFCLFVLQVTKLILKILLDQNCIFTLIIAIVYQLVFFLNALVIGNNIKRKLPFRLRKE